MLLLVVSWITATHFSGVVSWITATHLSGVSVSSVYVNYSASKIMQPEFYQTPADTPVYLLCLRNSFGFLFNITQFLKQPHLF